ncbi:MAG: hypothetical protein J3R72DRAFT_505899 [Linnemannia gamsii]|nr:MAG: hypothetical protein J3R72DRAFT_505899 [Linnemannia gamsii]
MMAFNFNTRSRCVYSPRVLLFLAASILLFTQTTSAQYTSPAPGSVYTWNYIADKALFVRQASQFYSLDLTPLLSANSNVAWKILNTLNGPLPELDIYQPVGVTGDRASIYGNHYVIPMTDLRTGIEYVQVKFNDAAQMLAYGPATKTRTFIPMPVRY